jgi:hypothetical protein
MRTLMCGPVKVGIGPEEVGIEGEKTVMGALFHQHTGSHTHFMVM